MVAFRGEWYVSQLFLAQSLDTLIHRDDSSRQKTKVIRKKIGYQKSNAVKISRPQNVFSDKKPNGNIVIENFKRFSRRIFLIRCWDALIGCVKSIFVTRPGTVRGDKEVKWWKDDKCDAFRRPVTYNGEECEGVHLSKFCVHILLWIRGYFYAIVRDLGDGWCFRVRLLGGNCVARFQIHKWIE